MGEDLENSRKAFLNLEAKSALSEMPDYNRYLDDDHEKLEEDLAGWISRHYWIVTHVLKSFVAENNTPQSPQTCGDKLDAEKQELWIVLDAIAHWKVTHQSYQIVVSDIRNYAADKMHELKKKYHPDEAHYDWQGQPEI